MANKNTAAAETTETTNASMAAAETAEAVQGPAKGSAAWWNQRVEIELFKDTKDYKDDVFVAVNGKTYQIKRGVKVMVPRFVAQVLQESHAQDMKTATMILEKENEYMESAKAHGLE